jgi:predicted nucleotidyltransferase
MEPRIPIDKEQIAAFCRKWQIVEFSLFGSVLTDEFREDSDVDVMVEFAEDAPWTIFDMVDLENELARIVGREVDVVTRPALERTKNYILRRNILSNLRTLYGA